MWSWVCSYSDPKPFLFISGHLLVVSADFRGYDDTPGWSRDRPSLVVTSTMRKLDPYKIKTAGKEPDTHHAHPRNKVPLKPP